MAWPPSSNIGNTGLGYETSNQPIALAWGTDGLMTSVIVTSMRASRMVEEIPIENGNGIVSTQVLLKQGDSVEITVIDDRNVTWPDSGQVITSLVNPLPNGTSATAQNFVVIDNSYQAARKAPGERTLLVKKYILITAANMV